MRRRGICRKRVRIRMRRREFFRERMRIRMRRREIFRERVRTRMRLCLRCREFYCILCRIPFNQISTNLGSCCIQSGIQTCEVYLQGPIFNIGLYCVMFKISELLILTLEISVSVLIFVRPEYFVEPGLRQASRCKVVCGTQVPL